MSEPQIKHSAVAFAVKAIDDGARTFTGYANTWDVDLGNDKVWPGAFTATLADWRATGRTIPLLNSHARYDIYAGLGQLLDAAEDEIGLKTTWEIIPGPDGDRVLDRLRPSARTGRGAVGALSIGYYERTVDFSTVNDETIRNLRAVDLVEASLVLFPMNTGSLIDAASVKAALAAALPSLDATERDELSAMLRTRGDGDTHGTDAPAPAWDTPGDTPLDHLTIKRLLTRAQTRASTHQTGAVS